MTTRVLFAIEVSGHRCRVERDDTARQFYFVDDRAVTVNTYLRTIDALTRAPQERLLYGT